jgi:hypothetical protein
MHPFGHIDLRVRDLNAVYPFYARILPELGFRNEWRGEGAFSFQAEGKFPKLSWVGVIEDHQHVANATRLAFAVESGEEVDRLAKIVRPKSITAKSSHHEERPRKWQVHCGLTT